MVTCSRKSRVRSLDATVTVARASCRSAPFARDNLALKSTRSSSGIAASFEGPHQTATIYLGRFPAGQLVTANLKRAHDFLRQRFNRADLTGSIFVGGTEAAWQARRERWLLHAHLLAIGVPERAWDRLDDTWADSGADEPFQRDELRDLGVGAWLGSGGRRIGAARSAPTSRPSMLKTGRWVCPTKNPTSRR